MSKRSEPSGASPLSQQPGADAGSGAGGRPPGGARKSAGENRTVGDVSEDSDRLDAREERAAPGDGNETPLEAEVGTVPDAGIAPEAAVEDPDTALKVARGERDEYLELLRRVQADFENYKKRMLRQQTELLERAAEGVVVRLLPALEAFDLARAHLGDAKGLSAEGKALVQASALLFDTLAKEGLERVEGSDVPFDPTVHEAVDHEPSEPGIDSKPVGAGGEAEGDQTAATGGDGPVVSAVLRPGYRWKGRVIRPAMVRVRG